MLSADIADIEILQILLVVFNINHILLYACTIRLTVSTGTLHRLQMW